VHAGQPQNRINSYFAQPVKWLHWARD